ncbi:MAG: endolytic transglycosylase MltG [Candidatus Kerfeldbacteria bacterium]|nr:endolytic transglycosylase MltG [Candidatus Kerfeldbacteria bacterium]
MPQRSTIVRNTVSFLVPTILVVAAVGWFFVELQPVEKNSEATVAVTIEANSGVNAIATKLEEQGLIRSRLAFQVAVVLAGIGKDLQAGTYEFTRGQSATAIARAMSKGPDTKEVELTVVEGWTIKQIGQQLEKEGLGTAQGFIVTASTHDSRDLFPNEPFDFLSGRPTTATLEGYLFPDTYRFFPDATAQDVVKKLLLNFGTKLTSTLRGEIAAQGRTIHEVVTLASIVEREVRTDRDRGLVADIFWRRLGIGMPLQSDATVNYVTGKSALQPTLTDTEVDSPYNTYRVRGLPPGPIGNPGLASLTATIRPITNDNLYFLTDSSGAVHYAKTYEDHLANKRQYLE